MRNVIFLIERFFRKTRHYNMKSQANERTFQGILLSTISEIISENKELNFSQITQEQNIGVGKQSRFADGLLYSSLNDKNITLFELKNSKWDATDEELVEAAQRKATDNGFDFFITGNPRQLVIYKTFETGKTIQERRIEIFNISTIRHDNEVLMQTYKTHIKNRLKVFLQKLSNLVHGVVEIVFDNINNFYINRLSAYILEASYSMWDTMIDKINSNKDFRNDIKKYLEHQDIFNLNKNLDNEDIYKLCQLANYMLYLKILFYSNLQRNVPSLNLRPLLIPEDSNELNKTLQRRFEDVLQHDYEMIFSPSVIDEFQFKNDYIPQLQRNTESIKTLNFEELNADIIGAIYNTLLDNQEQHDRGQHFTNTNEVDIINAFCISENTRFVIDTSCGAGTFLVRSYQFLKYFNPQFAHEQLIEYLWGIEIATFPAFLSVMNLCLLNIKSIENYPLIIRSDFAKIKSNYYYSGYFLNANKSKDLEVTNIDNRTKKVKLPLFDACVGNPPYIRQELIENKELWNDLVNQEHGIKKINQQSDLYVYYLMHTASFLKNGGRLGYVISHSWLDTIFGTGLQKFLLDNFKIIAIIDNQVKRSFETASINSVILILEKNSNEEERKQNNVKFIRIYKDYEDLIGNTWAESRIEKVKNFVAKIENTNRNTETKNYKIFIVNQNELELQSTVENKYTNGNWGAKFLRSPRIHNKIISKSSINLLKTSDILEIKRGFTTGRNDFFYLQDKTKNLLILSDADYLLKLGFERKKHKIDWTKIGWFYSDLTKQDHYIERKYVMPIFKSQKESDKLDVNTEKLKYNVLMCNENLKKLEDAKTFLSKYIKTAEEKNIQNNASVKNRTLWYDLTSYNKKGDFIFPSMFGEKYYTIDNRNSQVFSDCVNNDLFIKENYKNYGDIIFLILNSTLFRFFIDLYGRQLTGNLTISDVDVAVLKKLPVPNPELLIPFKNELNEIYISFKSREQLSIFEEVKQADRRRLDEIIFEAIGLENEDVDELYEATCNYVLKRKQKSQSVENIKQKQKFDFEETLIFIKERFPEIQTYEELIKNIDIKNYNIPNGKPKFIKQKSENASMFEVYEIYFKDDEQTHVLQLDNQMQIEIIRFLFTELEIQLDEIKIPTDNEECRKIYLTLTKQYNNYGEQMQNVLKKHRISTNYKNIYKNILFQ